MKTQIFKNYSEFISRENKELNGVSEEFSKNNPNYEKENETNKGCWNSSDCSGCSRCYDCSHCSGCSRCSGCSDCSGCSGCYDCYDCSHCSRCYDCSHCSGCYDCSRCYDCSHCSHCYDCSGCSHCSGCYDCYDCSGCSHCSDCSDCSGCSGCSDCSDCSDCSGIKNEKNENEVKEAGIGTVPVIENIHQKVYAAASQDGCLNMADVHQCETTHCRAGWVVHLAGEPGYRLERRNNWLFAAQQIYKASGSIIVSPTRFYGSNESALADMKRCADLEKEQSK